MEDDPSTLVAKRRRTSVKCDRKMPCTRCSKLRTPCQYFEVPKDPNAEKFEALQNEIAHLKKLLSNRPDTNQQASPSESMHTAITQTSPFDQLTLQNDAALDNAEFLSAHLSGGGSTITRSSWQDATRDFALAQHLPGDSYGPDRPSCMWTGGHLEPPRCGPSSWEESNSTFYVRRSTLPDAVACGIATSREAERWFGCFFEGSDRLVPVFSSSDTFASVRERSSLLFDVILTIGCKIHSGSGSLQYQSMHRHLRQRVSTHVLSSLTAHSVENVQALLVLACYWEKSWLFMDLALWMTQELKLPDAVEQMMTRMSGEGSNYLSASEDRALFQMARVCCGVYVLDKIFSLDGGKAAGIASSPSPRRLRCLLSHTAHSAIDFRLLSQVELNSLRTNIHASLTSHIQPPSTTTTAPTPSTLAEHHITTMLRNARLDLSLWLGDWTALSQSALANSSSTSTCVPTTANEHALNILNLRIQHQWALMNAHLKVSNPCPSSLPPSPSQQKSKKLHHRSPPSQPHRPSPPSV
ncbi:hypothetical protein MPH_06777 [Macrophomina phaseolina MS6]|uniref:Zn(2)-C6 fungal-type domain-containing protein n=1 Tax=Macrophomina phaseolina (strain MS6) TaxID=1126212 RepID=K2RTR9_MACPH|nr:hypothetical protein MPH_06777 [Macrophomina phaseolina MS6]